MRQLYNSRNGLYNNSNEPCVRLERSHDLAQGEPRELLAITHGCHAAIASGAMLSHRKTPFPGKDDSHGVRARVLNTQERVLNTRMGRVAYHGESARF